MINPWLEIPHSDYENHMREIGQKQVLSRLTEYYLDKYQPSNFALLGCSTGNGLEHVDSKITKTVFAIDINPEYLEITRKRFQNKIKNLNTLHLDIASEELPFSNIDLLIGGLILEYVEPVKALKKIVQTLNKNGVLAIIIQKNKNTTSVSKTQYRSLENLSGIFKEVDETKINKFLASFNLKVEKREEITLTENKSFISLEYRFKKSSH